MPFIDKLLEWENDEVMGENGNCFGILERRQGKSRDGLPKLRRRLQVVCIAFFFGGGDSLQIIPAHSISLFPVPHQDPTRKDLLDFKTSFTLVDQQVDVMRGCRELWGGTRTGEDTTF